MKNTLFFGPRPEIVFQYILFAVIIAALGVYVLIAAKIVLLSFFLFLVSVFFGGRPLLMKVRIDDTKIEIFDFTRKSVSFVNITEIYDMVTTTRYADLPRICITSRGGAKLTADIFKFSSATKIIHEIYARLPDADAVPVSPRVMKMIKYEKMLLSGQQAPAMELLKFRKARSDEKNRRNIIALAVVMFLVFIGYYAYKLYNSPLEIKKELLVIVFMLFFLVFYIVIQIVAPIIQEGEYDLYDDEDAPGPVSEKEISNFNLSRNKANTFAIIIIFVSLLIYFGVKSRKISINEMHRAGKLYNSGDYSGAIKGFDKALFFNPFNGKAYYYRGLSKFKRDDFNGAISDFNAVLLFKGNDKGAYYDRARSRKLNKDHEGALRDFDALIAMYPDHAMAYAERAEIKHAKGDTEGAMNDYNKALEIDKTCMIAFVNRAALKRELGYKEAEEEVRQAKEFLDKLEREYNLRTSEQQSGTVVRQ